MPVLKTITISRHKTDNIRSVAAIIITIHSYRPIDVAMCALVTGLFRWCEWRLNEWLAPNNEAHKHHRIAYVKPILFHSRHRLYMAVVEVSCYSTR